MFSFCFVLGFFSPTQKLSYLPIDGCWAIKSQIKQILQRYMFCLKVHIGCNMMCTHMQTHMHTLCTLFLLAHIQSSTPLSHTSTLSKQTSTQMSHDKLKIPLLALIMERMQKCPAECSHLFVYKPLKPTLTTNERPVQSVSNPVPIWASLPWASFAFVLWLSEGRALHTPA